MTALAATEISSHPLYRSASRRVQAKTNRIDATVTDIRLGKPVQHADRDGAVRVGNPDNWGDLSLTIDYTYATSPQRTRTLVQNVSTWELPSGFWDVLNAALPR